MIRFDNVSTDIIEGATFHVPAGGFVGVVFKSNEIMGEAASLLLGLKKAQSGAVYVAGHDLSSTTEAEYYEIFKQTGVVMENGGLISNLKVWENIILPVRYHTGISPQELEARVKELFAGLGMEESELQEMVGKLPGPLANHVKRLVAVVRSMLMEPRLMIYNALFEGFASGKVERLIETTRSFHHAVPKRTSLFLTADARTLDGVGLDAVISIE